MSPPESGRLRWCFIFAPDGQEDAARRGSEAPKGQEERVVKFEKLTGQAVTFFKPGRPCGKILKTRRANGETKEK